MTRLLAHVHAESEVQHGQLLVLDLNTAHPDPAELWAGGDPDGWLFAGPGWVELISQESGHFAGLDLYGYDGPPEPPGGDWEDVAETRLTLPHGQVTVYRLFGDQDSPTTDLGFRGTVRLRVHSRGREKIRWAMGGDKAPHQLRGIESYALQFWPDPE